MLNFREVARTLCQSTSSKDQAPRCLAWPMLHKLAPTVALGKYLGSTWKVLGILWPLVALFFTLHIEESLNVSQLPRACLLRAYKTERCNMMQQWGLCLTLTYILQRRIQKHTLATRRSYLDSRHDGATVHCQLRQLPLKPRQLCNARRHLNKANQAKSQSFVLGVGGARDSQCNRCQGLCPHSHVTSSAQATDARV